MSALENREREGYRRIGERRAGSGSSKGMRCGGENIYWGGINVK